MEDRSDNPSHHERKLHLDPCTIYVSEKVTFYCPGGCYVMQYDLQLKMTDNHQTVTKACTNKQVQGSQCAKMADKTTLSSKLAKSNKIKKIEFQVQCVLTHLLLKIMCHFFILKCKKAMFKVTSKSGCHYNKRCSFYASFYLLF